MAVKYIELPRAEDFCKGTVLNKAGKRCTIGWICNIFRDEVGGDSDKLWKLREKFEKLWHIEADKVGIDQANTIETPPTGSRNDLNSTTYKQLEEVFEKTVEKMGYKVYE